VAGLGKKSQWDRKGDSPLPLDFKSKKKGGLRKEDLVREECERGRTKMRKRSTVQWGEGVCHVLVEPKFYTRKIGVMTTEQKEGKGGGLWWEARLFRALVWGD